MRKNQCPELSVPGAGTPCTGRVANALQNALFILFQSRCSNSELFGFQHDLFWSGENKCVGMNLCIRVVQWRRIPVNNVLCRMLFGAQLQMRYKLSEI